MKGDRISCASTSDTKTTMSFFETAYRPDYFVTTRKLREMAVSGKPARYRFTSSKSAPPFQNRNLDNYPMPNSREDAIKSAKGHRKARVDADSRLRTNKTYSGSMKDYSKQMFDFAVKTANTKHENSGPVNLNQKERRRFMSNPNPTKDIYRTGPTPDGSILYNSRQRVLNSIRIRPHSELGFNNYVDSRSQSRLSLQETISVKNQQYKVLHVNGSSRPGSTSRRSSRTGSDLMLVPVDQNSENNFCTESKRVRKLTFGSNVSDYDENGSLDALNDQSESRLRSYDDTDGTGSEASNIVHRSLMPPTTACNIRLVSLDEESSSESEEEPEVVPPPEVKKPEPKSPLKKGKHQIPEPEPEVKPARVKVVLKGPRCWVDDATITSEPSDTEEDLVDGNEDQLTQVVDSRTTGLRKSITGPIPQTNTINNSALLTDDNKLLEKDGVIVNGENKDTEVPAETGEVVMVEDETIEDMLPPFLCPSSEKKSREAALKEWLTTTCFRTGRRAVPLV